MRAPDPCVFPKTAPGELDSLVAEVFLTSSLSCFPPGSLPVHGGKRV
jgi:hypothetical protein